MTLPPPDLPPVAVPAFQGLSDEDKLRFAAEFNVRKRSLVVMILLAVLFPIQLFFLGKIVLGILFLITGGGFGIWWVVEWFLTPRRVNEYNTAVANQILTRMGSPAA
jgi:hypothetical protein